MNFKYYVFGLCFAGATLAASAQEVKVPLDDMSSFQPQSGNWFVVSGVTMDPEVDIHQSEEPQKKKRKKKEQAEPQAVSFSPGTGVLLNLPEGEKKDNILTVWEHGDVELALEVMLPKGSNSGIYLQGRYEIQLLDSWGVKDPSFSDIGGIYRNWQTDPEESYMGKAPLVNAAKAPGLWQKVRIGFRAPRFNEEGVKTANARLDYVDLNGVRIHENIEIPKLTGGAISSEEAPTGPLMIQGDHGPVAIRNIRYKPMQEPKMRLEDLKYEVYKGTFLSANEMLQQQPESTGSVDALTYEVANAANNFGIRYQGSLTIPEAGLYTFHASVGGSVIVAVNNEEVVDGWRATSGATLLEQGTHPFELIYFKTRGWLEPRLGLTVKGENTYPAELHAFSSAPPDGETISPIFVDAEKGPTLLRAFLDYKGERSNRLTHTVGVGEPTNIHYVYNLQAGNIAAVWKGNFVDATPMWHDRGDGSFLPRGMIQYLSDGPALVSLSSPASSDAYRSKGYKLDENGRPVFHFTFKGVEVEDRIYPDERAALLTREINLSAIPENAHLKLAEGSDIRKLKDGRYLIGDSEYYITMKSDVEPEIRQVGGAKQLLVPVSNQQIVYSVTW